MWDTEGQTGSRRWILAADETGLYLIHNVQIGLKVHPGPCVMDTGGQYVKLSLTSI
jgi:hypothetical protein